MLFAELTIEVGPTLGLLLGTATASIISAVMSTIARRDAAKATAAAEAAKAKVETVALESTADRAGMSTELGKIHTAVNSSAAQNAAELRETKAHVLELSKLLVETQTNAAHQAREQARVPAAAPAPIGEGTKIEMRVEDMEVKAMKVHDPKVEQT